MKIRRPFLFKKGVLSICGTATLLSQSLVSPNVMAAPLEVIPNAVFSDDLEWMKSQLSMNGDVAQINFSNRFSELNLDRSIDLSANSSNAESTKVSIDNSNLAITINGFGESIITVKATDENGVNLIDQFQVNITKKGDLNGDGILNTSDVLQIYQVTSGKLTLSSEQLKLYDINGDGKVTNADASMLLSNYVGKASPSTITSNYFVQLKEVNDKPITQIDQYSVDEDNTLTINNVEGVLKNDMDVEKEPLRSTLVRGTEHGEVTLNEDGSFSYIPYENFNGSDKFIYTATDGVNTSEPTTVNIVVRPQNDPPMAEPDEYEVDEDQTLEILESNSVIKNDSDSDSNLQVELVSDVSNGTLVLRQDGTFSYKPQENYFGEEGFTYRVYDGEHYSLPTSVKISIHSVNDAPIGQTDEYNAKEDEQLLVNAIEGVLKNDQDVDDQPSTLKATLHKEADKGQVTLQEDGSFVYIPNENAHGSDSFWYTVTDGKDNSEPIEVRINVDEVNDPPTAVTDSYTLNEDTTISFVEDHALTINDYDPDGLTSTLIPLKVSDPAHGRLKVDSNGNLEYIPDKNYHGTDSFEYKLNDGQYDSNVVRVDLTITPVEDIPVIKDLNVHGNAIVGQTLTTSYTYSDDDGDVEDEDGSKFEWFRSNYATGDDKAVIDGENSSQYTIKDEDLGKYLFVRVTPMAASGETFGTPVIEPVLGEVQPKDVIRPAILNTLPSNDAADVSKSDSLTINLSENVKKGTGKIIIMEMGSDSKQDEVFHEYNVIDQDVQVQDKTVILIHPSFKDGTKYYVLMDDGVFEDESGNKSIPISKGEWTFTTEVLATATMTLSPLDGYTFDELLLREGLFVELKLENDTFKEDVSVSDFLLNNAPFGAEILGATFIDPNTVYLAFESVADFDQNIDDFTVTAKETALTKGKPVTSNTQTLIAEVEQNGLFISELLIGNDGPGGEKRIGVELYNRGVINPIVNIELVIYKYGPTGKSSKTVTINNPALQRNPLYLITDRLFYDAFDVLPGVSDHGGVNDTDAIFYEDGKVITALALRVFGQTVDVVGDIRGTSAILPSGGTMVRQNGLNHGLTKFNKNEWNYYPINTFNYFGRYNN